MPHLDPNQKVHKGVALNEEEAEDVVFHKEEGLKEEVHNLEDHNLEVHKEVVLFKVEEAEDLEEAGEEDEEEVEEGEEEMMIVH